MAPFRLSASHNELYELGCRPSHNYSSTTFSPSASALSTHTSVAALYSQLAFAERQIFILDAEIALLREKNENIWLFVKVLLAEIEILKVVFGKDTHLARSAVSLLQGKLTDYQEFNGVLAQGYPLNINNAHVSAEKRDIEATPIEDATHESDSSRSKVLQTLINHHDSESFVAAADMAYKLCRIPPEKEKAAHFADSQATPKFNGTTASVARLPLAVSNCRGNDNASTCSRSCPSSVRTVSISNTKEDQWALRPEGQKYRSLRTSHCPLETNCSRRFTFPNSVDIEVRTVEKRHGFLMPCIKPVLQKHASTTTMIAHLISDPTLQGNEDPSIFPVSSLSNASCSPIPSTKGALSLNHRNVSLSAERLCATFSSGSLGSLELTVSSSSNHSFLANFLSNDPRVSGRSSNVKGKNIPSCSTMVGNDKKRDSYAQFEKEILNTFIGQQLESTIVAKSSTAEMTDTNSYISSQEQQNDIRYPPPQVSSIDGVPGFALRLPSIESTNWPSQPSTNQVSQRFARPGLDPVTVDPLTPKDDHSQILARQGQAMRGGPAVQLRKMQTTSRKENNLKEVSWTTKVAGCSNRYLQPRTPTTVNYTLRPKLNIIKCGLAKPVESVRLVNRTNIPVPVSRARIAHQAGFTPSPISSRQVSPCKSIGTSACQKNIPISKPCSRLRVVNDCNPRGSSLTRSGTQLRMNLKGSEINTEKTQYQRTRIDCYGRIRSDTTGVEPPQFETQRSLFESKDRSPEKP